MSPPLPLSPILLRSPFIPLLALSLFSLLTVQSRPINQLLPHHNLGCPTIQFWGDQNNEVDACRQNYHSVADNKWIGENQNHTRVVTWEGDEYHCCDPLGRCMSSAEYGTCVYADNYCPTLVVNATDEGAMECIGSFYQFTNNTWFKEDTTQRTKLVLRDRYPDGTPMFSCEADDTLLGYISTYECQNPYEPLEYGLNEMADGSWLNVVGGEDLIDGSVFKAFQVTTPVNASEWVKVWPLTTWTDGSKGTVVIPQLYYDDPRYAVVELSDIDKVTFRMRVVHSPNCIENHVEQRVNILMMSEGLHKGSGRYAQAGNVDLAGGSGVVQEFDELIFNDLTPGAFVHIQEIPNENCGHFMQVSLWSLTTKGMVIYLETTISPAPHNCTASVGFIGIAAEPNLMPHFQWEEGKAPWVYHSNSKYLSHAPYSFGFNNPQGHNPIVFVQTHTSKETAATGEITAVRLHASSTHHCHFSVVKDRCETMKDIVIAPPHDDFSLVAFFNIAETEQINPSDLSPRGLMNQHLPHPNLGCPTLQFWANGKENDSGCKGLFYRDGVNATDSRWSNQLEGELRRYVTWELDNYHCCDSDFYNSHDRSCKDSPITVPSADTATCVYADNYCPTLVVSTADGRANECIGSYTQHNNAMWNFDSNGGITRLVIEGRNPDATFILACKKEGTLLGYISTYECQNPSTPLEYGLNKMADGSWLNVVGGDSLIDGSFFRAFQVTTPENAYEWMTVWVQTWHMVGWNPMVVIPQLFYDDPRTAVVELSDIDKVTFRMRVINSPDCAGDHNKDRVNILMMSEGVRKGYEGQMTVALRRPLEPVPSTPFFVDVFPNRWRFPTKPAAFSQIQQLVGGDDPGYHSLRISGTSTHEVEFVFDPLPNVPLAAIGYIAVSGEGASFFDELYHVVQQYSDDHNGNPLSISIRRTYVEDFEGWEPIVIVQTQTANRRTYDDPYDGSLMSVINVRLHQSSTLYQTFSLAYESCKGPRDSGVREGYALLSLYRKYPMGWTTTTTTAPPPVEIDEDDTNMMAVAIAGAAGALIALIAFGTGTYWAMMSNEPQEIEEDEHEGDDLRALEKHHDPYGGETESLDDGICAQMSEMSIALALG